MNTWRLSLFIFLFALPATQVSADVDPRDADTQMYPPGVTYNPAIPTPASVLGHELGEAPVRHHKLVEYIRTVADLSDRLTVETIGYTHERRPILFVVATSPANHGRIDEIREQHIALTEPQLAKAVTDDMPVVTWLNYGVHGAEASGMDASLPFIYYLAAAQSPELDRILDESVVLVTAIFNPDGHNQRIAWLDAYSSKRANSDPADMEHDWVWQFARTNHYWFDLNRQWLLLTQPEPRAWMKKWHEWRPNITVDYHEMSGGQTYYFHPGVATRTNPLAPDEAERLMAETARTSEAFLDSEGRLYYHGEDFDNFYIGKGSTFPLVNGGVGMLYEASATMGRELDTQHGLRTNRENIRKHFRTSIASIRAGVNLRLDYLRYQKSFYSSALREAAAFPTKAWVVRAADDPARLHFFADLLNYHRIKTHRLGRELSVDGQTYGPNDSLVVPVSQPQFRLIRSLFETLREFEDSTFYDVSTWTMPAAFGLQQAALGSRDLRGALGDEYSPPMPVKAGPEKSEYGYVFGWGDYYAPRALQRVLEAGLLASVATKPFTVATRGGPVELGRGSILVPFDRQVKPREDILALMRTIASEDGITVHSLESGRSVTGTAGVDVGGPSFKPLKLPNALLVVGRKTNLYDAGEIWHLLDFRMNMPLTLRDRDRLGGIKWDDYTHIIFSHGDYDGFEPEFADRLRLWVAEGGTLIGMRNAASWVRGMTLDWVDPESEEALAAETAEEVEEEPTVRLPYADKDSREANDVLGGAIFRADLDNTHPLGFGYEQRSIFLHKNFKEPMEPTKNPWATVIAYDKSPAYSGFVSEENEQALAETAALIAERSGAGSIILFADNPNFRGYWYGTNKLFLNAIFFSKVFAVPE
ncbi:MAG: hypothetical protein KJN78_06360, partial [Gammaproteobacteria bacterium]|nr:hypothetical protein [Gammaproteobacteria bacterium]